MYGWLWTNECCMCVRSTHAEVGRSGRVGRRKADLGPVVSSPRGGFGWIWGVVDGQSRAQKIGSAAREARAAGQVWGLKPARVGAHPGRTGGTTGGRLVGSMGFRGVLRAKRARRSYPGAEARLGQAWGTNRHGLGHIRPPRVGSVGLRGLFWPAGARKTAR